MRALGLVAVLALAAAAGGCGGSDENVGRVTDVTGKKVFVGSTEARDGDGFPAETRLATDRSGSVRFELDSGTGCQTRPNSELRIEPNRQVSIDFRRGTSFCWKNPGADSLTYRAGKLLVTTEDPVFGVTVDGEKSVVRVTFGLVEVETTAAGKPVVVGPDQQAVVSPQQSAPRVEEIELGPSDKRMTDALEENLPKPEAEPPGDLDEIVLGMAVSTPDSVRSFVRRLLATTWDIDARVDSRPEQELETSLREGTVDIVVAPESAAPSGEAVPLFTRQGTTWVAISPDSDFAQALRKLVTVSLHTGAYGDLFAESFAARPTYARAAGSGTTVIASEGKPAAPTTTITRNPPSPTTSTRATFEFQASKPDVLFSCRLDGADPEPCKSPQAYATILPGEHRFTVGTTDAAGNVGRPVTYTWIVKASDGGDTTVPTTEITSGPESETTSTDAAFAFQANDEAVGYGCSLDGSAFQPCESPRRFRNLPPGDHVFAVRAVDADEGVGRSESHSWTILEDPEAAGPRTRIDAQPARRTSRTTATFRFRSEPGTRFRCALDGTSFHPCTSPRVYRNLGQGRHVFAVRARAPRGRPGPEERYSWSIVGAVDLDPPVTTIVSKPPNRTSERDATFVFSSNEQGVSFSCSLDGSDFEPCSSPWPYEDLEVDAEHTFAVRATDPAGNIGEAVPYIWEIVFG